MNIVGDIGKFYQDNEREIIKSIEVNKINALVFILDNNGIRSLFDIVREKDGKKDIDKIKFHHNDYDIDKFEKIYVNSRIWYTDEKDKGNKALGGGSLKKIDSVVPSAISFKIENLEAIKSANLIDKHFKVLGKNYDFNLEKYDHFKENIKKTLEGLCYNDSKLTYNDLSLKKDKAGRVVFIYDYYKDSDDTIIKNAVNFYDKYIQNKLFNLKNKSGERIYAGTLGQSEKKFFHNINEKTVYNSFFYTEKNSNINTLKNYTKFLIYSKYIKNKTLILNYDYKQKFDINKNISDVYKDVYTESKSKDVKLLTLHSDTKMTYIQYYGYINTSNLYKNYSTLIEYDENSGRYKNYSYNDKIVKLNNYDIYKKLMFLLDNQYVNFFSENKDKRVESSFSGNKIDLVPLLEIIKLDLFYFVYKNDNIDLGQLFNKIIKFVYKNKLYFKKQKEQIKVDGNKLIKILELDYNLTGEKTMSDLKEKYKKLLGYVKFNSYQEMDDALNQKGKEEDKLNEDRFNDKLVHKRFLKEGIYKEANIENLKEASFIMGMLFRFINDLSESNTKERLVAKYDTNFKAAMDHFIEHKKRFLTLYKPDEEYNYRILENKLLQFACNNNSGDIDFTAFLYGYSEGYKIKNNKDKKS